MAKIYGLFGSMTGKLADVVMVVRNGEQVARKYQPKVANPSTSAQVASRAKLKLLSQLSAIMASVIAIRRMGSVSGRNMFVKVNYPATTFANDKADIDLSAVKLTKSVVAIPNLAAERGQSGVTVSLQYGAPELSRVVYVMFVKDGEELRLRGTVVQNQAGSSSQFEAVLPNSNGEAFIYAYGVRDNTDAARAIFGNLISPTGQDVAEIITSRSLTESDISITETRYFNLPAVG